MSGNTDTSEETLVIVDTGSEPRLTCLSFIFFTSHPSYPPTKAPNFLVTVLVQTEGISGFLTPQCQMVTSRLAFSLNFVHLTPKKSFNDEKYKMNVFYSSLSTSSRSTKLTCVNPVICVSKIFKRRKIIFLLEQKVIHGIRP